MCSSPWGTGWCCDWGWRRPGFVCAGTCPALGDGCDKGTCKGSPQAARALPVLAAPCSGEPGQRWALPGWWLLTSSSASEAPVCPRQLAGWEGAGRRFDPALDELQPPTV